MYDIMPSTGEWIALVAVLILIGLLIGLAI